jgi:uncharacterized protein
MMALPVDDPRDHAGLVVLPYSECLRLLASEPVGRVAFSEGGDVHVFPVNHRLVSGMIAFRTGSGTKLGVAADRGVVAFEVDRYDAERRTGWSVLVRGRAEWITDDALLDQIRADGPQPWRNEVPREDWVVIRPDIVTGRRLP